MPYIDNAQLPKGVQTCLSQAAQEVYRKAYNHAWETHRYAQDRYDSHDSRQVAAARIAWDAVKLQCARSPRGTWVAREECAQQV